MPITLTDVFTDEDGAAYVQAAPGKQTHYIGNCISLGDLPNPRSGSEPIWCLDENRNFVPAGNTKTPPSKITTDVTMLLSKTAGWMEQFVEEFCPFVLHYVQTKCGSKGVFGNWERSYSIFVESVPDDVLSNLGNREGGNPTTRQFSLEAEPGRIDSREMSVSRQTTTEAQALNDIWACPSQCASECGDEIGVCEHMQAAADAVGAGTANVLTTTDKGTTWAAAAADPFAADEHIIAGVCFEVDKDTTRWLVVRDGDAANPLEVAYSDDSGATWTTATVGSTNNEAAAGPQCLFAFGLEYIWLVTDDGNVFFSSDGGVTWTDQSASTASGGNALNAIHFIDTNIGYAVGAADTVVYTEDGGSNWTAATATGGGNGLNTLYVFARGKGQWLIVGDDGGDFYHSWDGTTTWTTGSFAGSGAGSINCIAFANDLTGLMVHDTAVPVGTVYHTIDGGRSWRALTTPSNDGLNSVIMCSPTSGFAVGEVTAATAVILEISG